MPCHRGSVSPRSRAPKLPCLFVPPCSHATVLPFPSVLPCPRSLVPTFPRAFMVPCLLVPSCSRTAVLPCFRASVSTHLFRFSTFEIFKCPNFEYLGVGMPVQRIFGSSEVPWWTAYMGMALKDGMISAIWVNWHFDHKFEKMTENSYKRGSKCKIIISEANIAFKLLFTYGQPCKAWDWRKAS